MDTSDKPGYDVFLNHHDHNDNNKIMPLLPVQEISPFARNDRCWDGWLFTSGYQLLLFTGHVLMAMSGTGFASFASALVLLGVGWNFLYVGGSTLLTEAYLPEEKNKVQGAMDFCVFSTMALRSFSACR